MIKNVFFDLDGTLLSLDVRRFMKLYMTGLSTAAYDAGFDGQEITSAIYAGMQNMLPGTPEETNEAAFWRTFSAVCGVDRGSIEPTFIRYYKEKFDDASAAGNEFSGMPETVKELKRKGYRLFLLTNPLFPRIAIEHRMKWARIDPKDFECLTTYETAHYCKPDPRYYLEVAERYGLIPDEILMVGNDAEEDGVAMTLGYECILTKEELINLKQLPIPCPLLTHTEAQKALEDLPDLTSGAFFAQAIAD